MAGIIDIVDMRAVVRRELAKRQIGATPADGYANVPGGEAELYGLTGAIASYAVLGIPWGNDAHQWAQAVLAHQREDGSFAANAAGHALCQVLTVLNALGQRIPPNVGPLAPLEAASLPGWLDGHDWTSTHKELYGGTAPLLADGAVSPEWVDLLTGTIAARLVRDKPLETWCEAAAPAWRVVSCIYHILEIYDAACIAYPQPDLLLDRLLNLDWPAQRPAAKRTECTDGDWAWLLVELGKARPQRFEQAMEQIRAVSRQRAEEWRSDPGRLGQIRTHDIYGFLWVTATLQHITREFFRGPYLHDIQNNPALLRLGRDKALNA